MRRIIDILGEYTKINLELQTECYRNSNREFAEELVRELEDILEIREDLLRQHGKNTVLSKEEVNRYIEELPEGKLRALRKGLSLIEDTYEKEIRRVVLKRKKARELINETK